VDGAVRLVNSYTAQDTDLVEAAIRDIAKKVTPIAV
jgi:DNA-directed RNA polymerase subunit K/omega